MNGSHLVLITGGARSGKSALAERMAAAEGGDVLYVATARALDSEMVGRIEHHRRRRPQSWRVVEAPSEPATALRAALEKGPSPDAVLVDCLTVFVSNVLLDGLWLGVDDREMREDVYRELEKRGEACVASIEDLVSELRSHGLHGVFVTNEVGLGVVPEYPAARVYRDVVGRVNQAVAAAVDEVWVTWSGIPVRIKPAPVITGWRPGRATGGGRSL